MRGRLATSLALTLVLGAPALAACGSDASDAHTITTVAPLTGPFDFDYTIPLGTATRIERGEKVDVIPVQLDAKLGQTIRIVNLDTASHEVGSWYVLAGSTLTYRFAATGTFIGNCTTHPEEDFTLVVTE